MPEAEGVKHLVHDGAVREAAAAQVEILSLQRDKTPRVNWAVAIFASKTSRVNSVVAIFARERERDLYYPRVLR